MVKFSMRIVGYRKSDFTAKDGREVKGYNVFTEEEIASNGVGVQCDKLYLSEQKVATMGLNLDDLVEKEVVISYNRWGKVSDIFVR